MPLFGKPKRAVISKEVYVRVRCVSPNGRGRAGTFQDERCAPAAPSLEGNSVLPLAQAVALRIYSYCKMVLADPL